MTRTARKGWSDLPAIFLCFLKIGPVTFGGGYAMIPLIEKEVVAKRKWIAADEIADVFAVGQSIPGAVAINAATFIGYRLAGLPGALAAMCGVLLPTFLIVTLLSAGFLFFKDEPKVAAAFLGIRAAVVALIVYAGVRIAKSAVRDKTSLGALVAAFALLLTPLHPGWIVVAGFAFGAGLLLVRGKKGLSEQQVTHDDAPEWGYMMGDGI